MPARKALSPDAGPLQFSAFLGSLPEREIAGVALQRVGFDTNRFQQIRIRNIA